MSCEHLTDLEPIEPSTIDGCEDCLKIGGRWVHLRMCMQCGHVGCYDNSPNKHTTQHFHDSKHGVIQSFEPGERWVFCYVDNDMFNPVSKEINDVLTDPTIGAASQRAAERLAAMNPASESARLIETTFG